jgi:choline dehydrogenase-like flavoprotein
MYDYVIVGAGSAGCTLTYRLTEDPSISVLLLEAGGPDTKQEIHIPVAFSKLCKTPVDWTYYTEEQAHLKQRKLYWPRGKVLGGSNSLNAMIYHRGGRHDYDSWAEAGNKGWSFADVLPYFKKARKPKIKSVAPQNIMASAAHSTSPTCVRSILSRAPLSRRVPRSTCRAPMISMGRTRLARAFSM